MIYILSIKVASNPDIYESRGLYESEESARATTLPGDFLINRYPVGTAFSSSLIDAGQTGAVFFTKISNDATVQDLSDRMTVVETHLTVARSRILVAEDAIDALADRVAVLEGQ